MLLRHDRFNAIIAIEYMSFLVTFISDLMPLFKYDIYKPWASAFLFYTQMKKREADVEKKRETNDMEMGKNFLLLMGIYCC